MRNSFLPESPTEPWLWHGIDTQKLKTFLANGLWLARLDQFKDPLEGTLSRPAVGLLGKLVGEQQQLGLGLYESAVLRSYAICFQVSDGHPNERFWEEFCSRNDGIAIRTSPQLLYDAIKPTLGPVDSGTGPGYFGKITYVDHNTDDMPVDNVLSAQFCVRRDYSDEMEARLLVHTHGTANKQLIGKTGCFGPLVTHIQSDTIPGVNTKQVGGHLDGKALVLSVNTSELIESIVINPAVPSDHQRSIRELIGTSGLGHKLKDLKDV
jgi:hypothetical protein